MTISTNIEIIGSNLRWNPKLGSRCICSNAASANPLDCSIKYFMYYIYLSRLFKFCEVLRWIDYFQLRLKWNE